MSHLAKWFVDANKTKYWALLYDFIQKILSNKTSFCIENQEIDFLRLRYACRKVLYLREIDSEKGIHNENL